MGTYSALGPLIKETVERLEGEEKRLLSDFSRLRCSRAGLMFWQRKWMISNI